MSPRKKDLLRPLTDSERATLTQLSQSQPAPAAQIISWFEAMVGHWNEAPTPFRWGGK